MAYKRKPVSSVHAIDSSSNPPKLSTLDSATVSSNGTVVHGRYGEIQLDPSAGIPLEYLALLYPAAQGAAALRTVANGAKSGTVLVYGAGHAAAMATLQLASADGLAVVGVVSGDQSGNDDFVDAVKCMTVEPGTVVPEEFAVLKANFREVVDSVVRGQDAKDVFDPETFLADFQENLLEYSKYFPASSLSPVPEDYTFAGKDKDRKYFDDNISAYLSQFQRGSPPFDEVILKEAFTKEQYAIFKSKFGKQLTAVITGDDDDVVTDFNPADIVKKMTESPEIISEYLKNQTHDLDGENGEFVPYEFSILKNQITKNVDLPKGGPVLGAVVNVTSDLAVAVEAVAKGKTLRDKAEALQFLTESQKSAYAAASSIVSIAKESGKPVVVVGGEYCFTVSYCRSLMYFFAHAWTWNLTIFYTFIFTLDDIIGKLPGFETIEPSNADVQEALSAMKLEEDGSSRLNYFIQVYRASDYPVYADYAIHRSQEELSGPRQFVVTK
jgi:hypothetical protein